MKLKLSILLLLPIFCFAAETETHVIRVGDPDLHLGEIVLHGDPPAENDGGRVYLERPLIMILSLIHG